MSLIEDTARTVARYGINHPWQIIIGYLLIKNPATRTWTLRLGAVLGRSFITETIFIARAVGIITFEELLVPGAAGARSRLAASLARARSGASIARVALAPAAPIAAAAVGAAVGAGVVTAAQQRVELVGPRAPVVSAPRQLGGAPVNPFFLGWGSVV